ncbi:hypothetical protein AAFF_G00215860 [Aldrovandia affinis]|uniref:Uncharacterized protein n=1 Tax=Aldrovandia affinis TaxID=143900 RepID=A0AAD7W5M3_9TELE|nr:hypothetical protein AAFF_G00215860 [Aldrovandia affinis]
MRCRHSFERVPQTQRERRCRGLSGEVERALSSSLRHDRQPRGARIATGGPTPTDLTLTSAAPQRKAPGLVSAAVRKRPICATAAMYNSSHTAHSLIFTTLILIKTVK